MSGTHDGRRFGGRLAPLAVIAVTGPFLAVAAPAAGAVGGPCVHDHRPQPLAGKPVGPAESRSSGGNRESPGPGPGGPWGPGTDGGPPWLKGRPGQLPIIRGHTEALQLITGPGSPGRTDHAFGVAGTDLGVALSDTEGRLMLVFGDTVACDGSTADWRSNTIVRTGDPEYGDGLDIDEALTEDGWSERGRAVEFIDTPRDPGRERTVVPTGAITVRGIHYVDYVSVRDWGDPGEWTTNYAGTVRSDDGVDWTLVEESLRTGDRPSAQTRVAGLPRFRDDDEKLQMSAFIEHDGYVYRFSTPSGRDGSAILGRAPVDDFPDESAFTYFDGENWFSPGDRNPDTGVELGLDAAATVIENPVSGLSVTWNEHLGRFIALHQTGEGLVLRTAEALTGPWSAERMVLDTGTVRDLHGGFILPGDSGRDLYFVATTWSNYNVLLMRTDLDELLGPDSAERPDSRGRISRTGPRPAAGRDYDPSRDDGLEAVGVVDYRDQ
ncbi:DUF4185 domain-containing protein [Corynebacterium sp. P5875]|uniref:DUF4185 domain-containing protein n=1 Tax=Corynebacterium antarcticum TaxID=2800405 RepID=A0A9Q4GPT8_9CORY|nr:DUF4185 domain-containing protein [Corynebacterium antarcticum]MCX7539004.1 DUF4185 domain-containing protein [Corynebacterium antarcticum]